jgi:hypothetical protein
MALKLFALPKESQDLIVLTLLTQKAILATLAKTFPINVIESKHFYILSFMDTV